SDYFQPGSDIWTEPVAYACFQGERDRFPYPVFRPMDDYVVRVLSCAAPWRPYANPPLLRAAGLACFVAVDGY
ncbi:MAG: hypothetical protein AAF411_22730, partial [Myxococcota bacterium]